MNLSYDLWKKCTFRDVLSQPITDGPHETPNLIESGVPFISVESIHDGIVDVSKKRGFISEEDSRIYRKKYCPKKNDIFVVKSASVGKVGMVGDDTFFDIWSPLAALRVNDDNDPRFIFHLLQTSRIQNEMIRKSSKSSQPNLSMRVLESIEITVPPKDIQHEISVILDTFTTLIAELTAELTARKLQYEFYRDKLLSFDHLTLEERAGVRWMPLCDLAEIGTGSSNTNEGFDSGLYPFFVRSQVVRYKNTFEYDETAIITSGDGVGVGKIFHFVEGKYALHQRAYRIHVISNALLPKFLFHYMRSSFEDYIKTNAVHASVTSIRRSMLERYPVPIVSLQEQERIIEILDRFEMLCEDLSRGIPAEIKARRKQYEYYLNKLLTFEEASS